MIRLAAGAMLGILIIFGPYTPDASWQEMAAWGGALAATTLVAVAAIRRSGDL